MSPENQIVPLYPLMMTAIEPCQQRFPELLIPSCPEQLPAPQSSLSAMSASYVIRGHGMDLPLTDADAVQQPL